jgi:HK97 gp10 family phage protein
MAKRFNIQQLRKDFEEFDRIAQDSIKAVIQSSADIIVANAKRRAPANLGKLRQSIGKEEKKEGFEATVFVGEKYGVYVEFGTKTKVEVPPELQNLAAQFKGGGGKLEEMKTAIRDWVIQKRISTAQADNLDSIVFFITRAILKNGVKPQPYFWPAFVEERPNIPVKIDKILQREAKKFNDK